MSLINGFRTIRRHYFQLKLILIRDGWKKAKFMKKHRVFHYMGEKVFYTSNLVPAEPFLVSIHDNVIISAGVRIITHSVENIIFNNEEELDEATSKKYICKYGKVEIKNNVYVGADVKILPGITIGNNCIIAAGAVVTKDVPDNSVMAGVPAKKIGTYDELKRKSQEYSQKFGNTTSYMVEDLMKIIPVEFEK